MFFAGAKRAPTYAPAVPSFGGGAHMRRSFALFAGAVVVTLSLAACSTSVDLARLHFSLAESGSLGVRDRRRGRGDGRAPKPALPQRPGRLRRDPHRVHDLLLRHRRRPAPPRRERPDGSARHLRAGGHPVPHARRRDGLPARRCGLALRGGSRRSSPSRATSSFRTPSPAPTRGAAPRSAGTPRSRSPASTRGTGRSRPSPTVLTIGAPD
jgi:hypothetical protein